MRTPPPPPAVPGKTAAERMDSALKRIFSAPKSEVLCEEAKQRGTRKPRKSS